MSCTTVSKVPKNPSSFQDKFPEESSPPVPSVHQDEKAVTLALSVLKKIETTQTIASLAKHEEKDVSSALPVVVKIEGSETTTPRVLLEKKIVDVAPLAVKKAEMTPKTLSTPEKKPLRGLDVTKEKVPSDEGLEKEKSVVTKEKVPPDEGLEKEKSVVTKEKVPPDEGLEKEKSFIERRKKLIEDRLNALRNGYTPFPADMLYYCPGIGSAITRIVQKESKDVLENGIEKLRKATTRQKIAALLRKTKKIMEESMFCMNTATVTKMQQGCAIIEHELKKLGHVVVADSAKVGEKKSHTIDSKDSLFSEKTSLMKKLDDWKKDFDPQPQYLLSCVSGVGESVKNKAMTLFSDLYKGIVKAESAEKLCGLFKTSRELVTDYGYFVSPVTWTKLVAVCRILESEEKELAVKS
jgi:hypothetical protein